MTRIKICGITNEEDACAAVDYGADALGFIFVPNSPRYVGALPNASLLDAVMKLPPFITRVCVCRQWPEPSKTDWWLAWEALQYYVSPSVWDAPGLQRIHAFAVKDQDSLKQIEETVKNSALNAILLDTYHKDKLGGSGETFNWEIAVDAKERFKLPLILAGGLTAENVGDAIAQVRPFAVDVSSGVEAEPGRKDHAKLKAFCDAVRKADAALG